MKSANRLIQSALASIYEYGKAQAIVKKQKNKIAKNPDAEVKIQLGFNTQAQNLMETVSFVGNFFFFFFDQVR
jgi:hypothetical protein